MGYADARTTDRGSALTELDAANFDFITTALQMNAASCFGKEQEDWNRCQEYFQSVKRWLASNSTIGSMRNSFERDL